MRYTKVGRLVYVQGQFYINAVSSPSGDLSITGLPFTVNNNTDGEGSGYPSLSIRMSPLTGSSIGSTNNSYFAAGTTYIVVRGFNGLTDVATVSANLQVGTYVMLAASYTI